MPAEGGSLAALRRAQALGCDCLQLFLRPNRQWAAPELTAEQVARFRRAAAESSPTTGEPVEPIVAHASYLINLAGPPDARVARGRTAALSLEALVDELRRAALLGVPYVVLHPGSHMGDGDEVGLRRVVEGIDRAMDAAGESQVTLLVETTAGQGSAVGWRLEHLEFIVKHVARGDRVGVCADTAHMFAAGYDLRTAEGWRETMDRFERLIGLHRLAVWHLNDALRPMGSRVDRHDHIGRGRIGREGFRRLVTDPRFRDRPMILETPKESDRGYPMDPVSLRLLRRLAGGK